MQPFSVTEVRATRSRPKEPRRAPRECRVFGLSRFTEKTRRSTPRNAFRVRENDDELAGTRRRSRTRRRCGFLEHTRARREAAQRRKIRIFIFIIISVFLHSLPVTFECVPSWRRLVRKPVSYAGACIYGSGPPSVNTMGLSEMWGGGWGGWGRLYDRPLVVPVYTSALPGFTRRIMIILRDTLSYTRSCIRFIIIIFFFYHTSYGRLCPRCGTHTHSRCARTWKFLNPIGDVRFNRVMYARVVSKERGVLVAGECDINTNRRTRLPNVVADTTCNAS